MLVGLLSDSHGRAEITRAAVDLLRSRGAVQLIHCGDVGDYGRDARPVIDALACGPACPAAFVWGNNDDPGEPGVSDYAASLGVTCLGESGVVEAGGLRLGVAHGDRPALLRRLVAGGVDALCVGHSHEPLDGRTRDGRTRLVNPGALYRASVKSVALLDTADFDVEGGGVTFVEVPAT